jgi:hypothetical protein
MKRPGAIAPKVPGGGFRPQARLKSKSVETEKQPKDAPPRPSQESQALARVFFEEVNPDNRYNH